MAANAGPEAAKVAVGGEDGFANVLELAGPRLPVGEVVGVAHEIYAQERCTERQDSEDSRFELGQSLDGVQFGQDHARKYVQTNETFAVLAQFLGGFVLVTLTVRRDPTPGISQTENGETKGGARRQCDEKEDENVHGALQ